MTSLHLIMAALVVSGCASASLASSSLERGEAVAPPLGYSQACQRIKGLCDEVEPARVVMNEGKWEKLTEVDDLVNRNTFPLSDKSNWQKLDYWSLPRQGLGDCEDYALEKRRLLIKAGWPKGALSIAYVETWDNAGHAVLVVATNEGDLVLDNLNWRVVPWDRSPYLFKSIQSGKGWRVVVKAEGQS
ncbi:MAG: transglutaminase-like cysteine peptidase [Parvibaculaceae bacterium]|nr:transglutaminase-like cysteine peptidase [Parvibaculaceae bacterium]